MHGRNLYRSGVARFLLVVQLFMLTNSVVFRHAHRLPDGTIVVHAHPFLPKALGGSSSDPIQPNDHSRQQLVWLDALTDVCYPFTEPTFFVFQVPGESHLLPAGSVWLLRCVCLLFASGAARGVITSVFKSVGTQYLRGIGVGGL